MIPGFMEWRDSAMRIRTGVANQMTFHGNNDREARNVRLFICEKEHGSH